MENEKRHIDDLKHQQIIQAVRMATCNLSSVKLALMLRRIQIEKRNNPKNESLISDLTVMIEDLEMAYMGQKRLELNCRVFRMKIDKQEKELESLRMENKEQEEFIERLKEGL